MDELSIILYIVLPLFLLSLFILYLILKSKEKEDLLVEKPEAIKKHLERQRKKEGVVITNPELFREEEDIKKDKRERLFNTFSGTYHSRLPDFDKKSTHITKKSLFKNSKLSKEGKYHKADHSKSTQKENPDKISKLRSITRSSDNLSKIENLEKISKENTSSKKENDGHVSSEDKISNLSTLSKKEKREDSFGKLDSITDKKSKAIKDLKSLSKI